MQTVWGWIEAKKDRTSTTDVVVRVTARFNDKNGAQKGKITDVYLTKGQASRLAKQLDKLAK